MSGPIAGEQLRSIVERIERLEEEKKALADDIREIYAEAKANGFDPKTIRQVVKLRAMDKSERDEQAALLDLYLNALGMLGDTPLGTAAVDAERQRLADVEREAKPPPKKPSSRVLKQAAKVLKAAFGETVPLTDGEKASGQIVAFVDKNGMRSSIGTGKPPA